ncbi:MAG: D-glycero-beta-D-manno-heptose 1-phosphate adenylyltransferase [Sulfuriferula sp.]|nr:D-glycero-beta-D-manno-heptose 1-phosphate adenylyltransferase [Sulfuriferula sp.]
MPEYLSPDFESKIVASATLHEHLAMLQRPLVFTNGCFDILHRGHVTYLAQARALGAALVVGVNSDASVRRQGKGGDRPINPLENRMAVLAALASVDMVVAFDEDTPLNLIRAIHPEVLVKGGDWAVADMVGSEDVLGWGGGVYSIPFLYTTSTTATLTKIRELT